MQMKENTQYGVKNNLRIKACKQSNDALTISCVDSENFQEIYLHIIAYSDDVLRFNYSNKQEIAYETRISIIHKQTIGTQIIHDLTIDENPDKTIKSIKFSTKSLQVFINNNPLAIAILNQNKQVISCDVASLGFWTNGKEVRCYKSYDDFMKPPIIYGLGDKTGPINRWGQRFRNEPIDALGYDSQYTDPLYKDIPFFIHLDPSTSYAHGIFFDNYSKKFFDFGKERKPALYYYFGAYGGELNYYFINGPKIEEVLHRYLDLTGKPPMIPGFSLGYLASSMYYTDADKSSEKISDMLSKSKNEDVVNGSLCPTAFHMSSGYIMSENKKRLQFYWNYNKFPDPKAWAKRCQGDYNLDFCANVKPVILCEHPWYEELSKKGVFIKSGSSDLVAEFWGGKGSFIDFKNPKAQEWWKQQYKEHILGNNIRGIWNDNNEFEIFSEHEHSGNEMELALLMNRLAWEASLEYAPNRRPWVLTRSGFAGIQRYAQTWTGDNNSSWKSLQYDNAIVSGMAISGLIHSGTDIGGFWGESPSSELLTRWIQNGVFMPRFCIHSYKPNVTEPWLYKDSNPDHYEIIKSYMKLRKELFPYLYSASYQAHSIGRPIQRLLAYDFQNDSNTWEQSFEYMFGDALLIAPIYEPQASSRELYLPRIEEPQVNKWIDYWTHKEYVGGQKIRVPVSTENIPVFVKANSIIPLQINGLELKIFLAKNDGEKERTIDISYELYEDDRETLNYLKGDYLKSFFTFKFKLTDKDYTLIDKDIKKEGTYSNQYEKTNIKIFYNTS